MKELKKIKKPLRERVANGRKLLKEAKEKERS
jgi:hypothetical protein